MDKTAPFETVITSAVYLNSSFSGESSASMKFVLHSQGTPPSDLFCESRNPVGKLSSPLTTQLLGPSRIYLGTCDVLEPGFSVELNNEEFSATVSSLNLFVKPLLNYIHFYFRPDNIIVRRARFQQRKIMLVEMRLVFNTDTNIEKSGKAPSSLSNSEITEV